jgi:hypothetical protein
VAERFVGLQAAVTREILTFSRPPFARPLWERGAGLKVAQQHEARGVYELAILASDERGDGVRRLLEAREQARFVRELPLALAIVDETTVMCSLEDPIAGGSELTMIVVEHPALARLCKLAFEAVWTQGLTFEQARALLGQEDPSAQGRGGRSLAGEEESERWSRPGTERSIGGRSSPNRTVSTEAPGRPAAPRGPEWKGRTMTPSNVHVKLIALALAAAALLVPSAGASTSS